MRPGERQPADTFRALEADHSIELDWIVIVASPAMISTWCEGERITSPKENR
jgi:hypothetical protein